MPLGDAQIAVTIFGINGGQMMMGDDIDRMDEERLRMIRLVFPRLTEAPRALDLFEKADLDYPRLFHLPVHREWDRWELLAVFNLENSTLGKPCHWNAWVSTAAPPTPSGIFWNQRFEGCQERRHFRGSAAHRRKNFCASPASATIRGWFPRTCTFARGQAEVLDCRWDDAALTLTIRAQRPRQALLGSVYVHAPMGWALEEPKGLWLARDGRDKSLIIRKALEFEGAPCGCADAI